MKTVEIHEKVIIGYSAQVDGNMDERFADRSVVVANRRKFLHQFGLNPKMVIEGKQIHSTRILVLDNENTKMWLGMNIPGVDGFITNQNDVGLILKVADCIPLVIYDPAHHAIALLHVGWRGAVGNIHTLALTKMNETYGTDPKNVLVWVGPSAHQCHFVSPEKPEQIDNPLWFDYMKQETDGWHIDLIGFIKKSLIDKGVNDKNFKIEDICTIESQDLYSHLRSMRSAEPEGRFLVLSKLR